MIENAWIIPLFPLLSFLVLILFGRRLKESSFKIAIFLTLLSTILSILVLFERFSAPTYKSEAIWLGIGEIQLTVGFEVNQLNALMLVIVSLVSFLVHTYSAGYMKGDDRFSVYYAYLGLFTFAMLGLVLSPNLLQTYIFWELVGVGSFLLIGFYFYKEEAKQAAKKAFIMTRIGDVGLLIAMILLFWQVGSFEYDEIFQAVSDGVLSQGMITLTAILIFIGAVGKSGQFPLHTWLPDAMEGPTPVSALIHAATMVAAGVYLVAAVFPLFEASDAALMSVAIVGAITAIFAATIALVQTDIKRVLAYSTISQLGYMMLALGSAGYVAGVFHLTTHAFFKALLFLAAGSVIHAVHTQDIEKMGGLWKKLPKTGLLFLIGTMAISGVPLLSGFFSKDEILISIWNAGHPVLFTLAIITAFLTAFYMFRLFFMVFMGKSRGEQGVVQESPAIMTLPMLLLAMLAVFAGYINTPWFGPFLGDWLTNGHGHEEGPFWIMIVATVLSLLGIYLAWLLYGKKSISRTWLSGKIPAVHSILYNKYYVDEIYQYTVVAGAKVVSLFLKYVEWFIVEGIAELIKGGVQGLGKLGSKFQSGQTQVYGTVAFVGLALLVVIFALTGGGFIMNWLSILVFSPLIGMLVISFIPKLERKLLRAVGILATLPAMIISLILFFQYRSGTHLEKFEESYNWFSFKNSIQYGDLFSIKYELGIDGLSLVLLVLTTVIATLAAIASIAIKKELKGYFLLFLLLEIGMLGVFASQNFILFFLFFEITLVSAFFLIGKWGYEEKEKAAFSFLIYNGLGSAILLIVIITLFAKTGTTNFTALQGIIASDTFPDSLALGLFVGLLVAFGFKMPIVPLHSWMVRVHVQAPPAVVMIHAGILLKIGAYGLIRFNIGLFPDQAVNFSVLLAVLGVINLLYGAFLALVQSDFKMVLAYSSVSHMGIVLIGLGSLNEAGIQGAIFQMISHGLIAALLFFLVGVFYERTKTSEIPNLGGMAKAMPLTAGFLLVGVMASLGLPGLSGFVSEFMAFLGLFKEMPWLAAVGAIGIIMTAVYLLRAVLGVTYGIANREWAGVVDLRKIESIPVIVLTALIVAIGVYPNLLGGPLQETLELIMLKVGG